MLRSNFQRNQQQIFSMTTQKKVNNWILNLKRILMEGRNKIGSWKIVEKMHSIAVRLILSCASQLIIFLSVLLCAACARGMCGLCALWLESVGFPIKEKRFDFEYSI